MSPNRAPVPYARKTGVDLVITEGPDDEAPKLDGWAAAVRATHLITGEITPPPADDIQQLLDSLEMYGNNGWGDFKTNVGTQTKLLGQRLADAGCSPDYVVSYYIGHGLAWDTADRLHTFLRRNVKLA